VTDFFVSPEMMLRSGTNAEDEIKEAILGQHTFTQEMAVEMVRVCVL